MRNEDRIQKNDDIYERGYRRAVQDVLFSILSYVPKSQDYHDKCTMQRCRDDIASKIGEFSKDRKHR